MSSDGVWSMSSSSSASDSANLLLGFAIATESLLRCVRKSHWLLSYPDLCPAATSGKRVVMKRRDADFSRKIDRAVDHACEIGNAHGNSGGPGKL